MGDAHALAGAARRGTVIARATVGVAGAAKRADAIGIVARAGSARGAVGAGGALAGHAIAVGPAKIDLRDAQPALRTIRGHSTRIAHLASGIAALTHWAAGHGEAGRARRAAGAVETSGYAHRPRKERTERLAHVAGSARGTDARIAGSDANRPVVPWYAQGSGPTRAVLGKDRTAGHRTVARGESDRWRNTDGRLAGQRDALAAVRAGAAGQNRAGQGLSIGPGRQGVGPTRSRIGRRWQLAAIGRRPRGVRPASDRCVGKTTRHASVARPQDWSVGKPARHTGFDRPRHWGVCKPARHTGFDRPRNRGVCKPGRHTGFGRPRDRGIRAPRQDHASVPAGAWSHRRIAWNGLRPRIRRSTTVAISAARRGVPPRPVGSQGRIATRLCPAARGRLTNWGRPGNHRVAVAA